MGQRRKVILVTDGDIYLCQNHRASLLKTSADDVFPVQKEIQANGQDLNLFR